MKLVSSIQEVKKRGKNYDWQDVALACAICGGEVPITPMRRQRLKGGETAFYCSPSCRAKGANPKTKRKLWLTKEELNDLYLTRNFSIIDIAEQCDVAPNAVFRALKRFDILIKPAGWHQRGSDNNRYGKIDHIKHPRRWNEELGHFVRSEWEAIFAQWLHAHKLAYIYEPPILALAVSYRPDFYVLKWHKFVEVKGRWYKDAKAKFDRFVELFPDTILLEKPQISLIKSNPHITPSEVLKAL